MAEDEDQGEKPFEASAKKLEDARKKGEVPRSTDLNGAAAYSGFVIVALTLGPLAISGLGGTLRTLLTDVDTMAALMLPDTPAPLLGGLFLSVGWYVLPWFGMPILGVVLAVIVQRSFTVAPTKLAPKLNRISPISGAKNKFGRKGLFEFFKSALKLSIYGVILFVFLGAQRDTIIGSARMSTGQIVTELGQLVITLLAIVCAVAWTIGAIDFLFQRAEHLRKHRMTRKEMMDELKNAEGDPAMKQQRRQKAVDIATNQMMRDVPKADVIVVNPTHYAVALTWSRMPGEAPVCVAKGTDEVALRIRELGLEHGVPIHSDPPTARALHAGTRIGDEIAADHYQAVAAAIRFAEAMRKRARESGLS